MANYNKVLLMGRLTRDPEPRYTPQGMPVADVGIAVNREFQSGEDRRKETVFVDVTFWSRRAEVVCQYFKKGDPIFIEGRLTMDTWESQEGQKRSKLKVVAQNFEFVSSRAERESARTAPATAQAGSGGFTDYEYPGNSASGTSGEGSGSGSGSESDPEESDIPF